MLTDQELEKKALIRQKKHNNKLAKQFPLFQDNLEYFNPLSIEAARTIVKKNQENAENFAVEFDRKREAFNQRCHNHITLFEAILRDYTSDYFIEKFYEFWSTRHEVIRSEPAYLSDYLANLLTGILKVRNCAEVHFYFEL